VTENAHIARLWSGFQHLSEARKDLVIKIVETAKQRERSCRTRRTIPEPEYKPRNDNISPKDELQ
jgi:hypothetical protein